MSSVPIPSKGDIVTIENKQYRVLKVSGTIVEVLAMYDATTSQIFNTTSKTVTFTSGDSGQQYKGSDVDTYLNETFFATLSTTMRTAIVPKNINQDMWGDSSSLIHYRPYYHLTYGSEEKYYYVGTYGTADVGSRNVYILSIGDIIDYLGVPDNGDFTDTDILQMFWGETSNRKSLWLCSAYGKDNRYIYYVDTYYNYISGLQYNSGRAVRPAFQIDWNILYPSTPALTFKHFYDAGTIGSGTVKFRHYSQQEPTPPTYAVAITTDGANDSLCAYKLWSTADQANPTSGTMVYQNDGITSETVTIEVDKKYLVIVVVDNDGFRGADFVTVKGSVSKLSGYVVEVSGPGEAYIDRWTCLTGDTLITIADGTKKRIDELTLQDKVFAIDPETGKFVADEITYTDSTEYKTYTEYDKWTFSDGTIVKTVHRHRFYNVEKQAMVYMDEWNIGEHAVNQNGEYIALVSHENVKEEVKHYTLFTKHQNYFANGLLSGNRYTAELHLKR